MYFVFFRKCCTRPSPWRLHQALQHEILPFRPKNQISAECQRDQVRHILSHSVLNCSVPVTQTLDNYYPCFGLHMWNMFVCFRHDTININLKDKPDWFLEKNPLGLVPTLETPAGEVIYESPITCDYLDEVYPENKLLPSSPYAKAQQKMMLEHFSKVCDVNFFVYLSIVILSKNHINVTVLYR